MLRTRVLTILERALLTVGVVAGAWCGYVLLEARFTRSLPLEPVKVTMTLPGDENGSAHRTPQRVAPKAGTVIGKLTSASLNLSTPLLEGSDDGTLRRGAGHIEDTPFPGEAGNIGIAGHRDTVFRPLKRAKAGDALELTTADRVYQYRVTKTLVVNPDDVYVLDRTDRPTLTLVTCYPFEYIGHAPRRFIVQAELIQ